MIEHGNNENNFADFPVSVELFTFLRGVLRAETLTDLLQILSQFYLHQDCEIISLRNCEIGEMGLPCLEPETFWVKPGSDARPWEAPIHIEDDDSLAAIWILSGGPPTFITDLSEFALFTGESLQFRMKQGITSLYHILIRRHDKSLAVLSVKWRTRQGFSAEYKATIEFLSWFLSPVIENIQLKKQNDELLLLIQELEQQLKDAEARLHTLVHDLKQPLTSIITTADLLNHYLDRFDKSQIAAKLARIIETGAAMGDWISSILLLAQARSHETIEMETVDAHQSLKKVISAMEDFTSGWQAQLQYDPALDHLPPVRAVPAWLEHIWVNFISNACKYGGRPPQITLAGELLQDRVRFTVRDNGTGIPIQEQFHIFEPFVRLPVKQQIAGTGVGLTIVKVLAEKMGGEVGVESSPGNGSIFWFTLSAAV